MSSTSRKARKGSISYREVDSEEDVELEDQSESGRIKSMGSLGVIKKTVGDTYGSKQATSESIYCSSGVDVVVLLTHNLPLFLF